MATKSYPLILCSDTDALFYGNFLVDFYIRKIVCLYVSMKFNP